MDGRTLRRRRADHGVLRAATEAVLKDGRTPVLAGKLREAVEAAMEARLDGQADAGADAERGEAVAVAAMEARLEGRADSPGPVTGSSPATCRNGGPSRRTGGLLPSAAGHRTNPPQWRPVLTDGRTKAMRGHAVGVERPQWRPVLKDGRTGCAGSGSDRMCQLPQWRPVLTDGRTTTVTDGQGNYLWPQWRPVLKDGRTRRRGPGHDHGGVAAMEARLEGRADWSCRQRK
ncbi:MAG: hypothetical protein QOE45_1129 [Frankiaceae bacterium]|nr:hypothetical protein [Frankiaceae bacterium]